MLKSLAQIGDAHTRQHIKKFVLVVAVIGILQGVVLGCFMGSVHALCLHDYGATVKWLLALFVGAIINALSQTWATMQGFKESMAILATMHQRLGERLVHLPLGWFDANNTGVATGVAVRGTLFVAQTVMDLLVPLILNSVTPLTIAVLTCFLEWRLGILLLLSAPVIALAARWGSLRNAKAEVIVHKASQVLDQRLLEFIDHQALFRSTGIQEQGYAPLFAAVEQQRQATVRSLWSSVLGLITQSFVVQCAFGLAITYGIFLGVSGQLSPAWVLVLIGLCAQFMGPLKILSELGTAFERARIELDDVVALMNEPTLADPSQPLPFPDRYDIAFNDVYFRYAEDTPWIFDGLSLSLYSGSLTALVGPSGCGKTTLARLIARFWDVSAGSLSIGGHDIRQFCHEDLMRHISLVFQDVYLFDDTLEANIRLGNPSATDEQLHAAAELACVTDIVKRLPEGWQTSVGQGGCRLSGGERQRVSLARAVLKNAPILLLDEVTAAQDALTEAAITRAIATLAQQSTTIIVIAHNMNTIRMADNIVFIDECRVQEQGDHASLIERNGRYAHFWKTQYGGISHGAEL